MKNRYESHGDTTTVYLRLSGSVVECLIDTEDLSIIEAYEGTWYAFKSGRNIYALIATKRDGKWGTERMHRVLLSDTTKESVIDHINRNGLDNRKSNIRACTRSENSQNKHLADNNTSGFRGVSFDESTGKWRARVQITVGYFESADEANLAAVSARRTLMSHSNEDVS